MYQIEVRINFRAGHRLLPPYKGKCTNVHGEYFGAIFVLEKVTLDENGMLIDFGVVKDKLKNWIDEYLDHAYIYNKNDEVGIYLNKKGFKTYCIGKRNPTAENLAEWLYHVSKNLLKLPVIKVGVIESTETNTAWYCFGWYIQ